MWHFLRTFNLPYCSLYEQGYTSLGKKSLTLPNPALQRKYIDESGALAVREVDAYWPAYMLSDWRLERAGRVNKPEVARIDVNDPAVLLTEGRARSGSRSESFDALVRSAAMVIIGDEILSGFTPEGNLQVATRALASIGIPLKMVSIVSDKEEEIAAEVLRMSQRYDIVLTSGGIGPTHDDVTLRAVAAALKQGMALNSEMVAHLEEVQAQVNQSSSRGDLTSASSIRAVNNNRPVLDDTMLRLAMLPENAKLRFAPAPDDFAEPTSSTMESSIASTSRAPSVTSLNSAAGVDSTVTSSRTKTWPVLQCENIFVLPGIPQFFADKMHLIVKHFLPKNKKPIVRKIVLDLEERSVVTLLDILVKQHSEVKFGSYPFIDHPDFKTIITLEGLERRRVELAVAALLQVLPVNAVLRVEKGAAAQHV